MRALLCWLLLASVTLAGGEAGVDEFPIKDFFFSWHVETSDAAQLSIRKTPKGTTVDIRYLFPCYLGCDISLTPDQAAAVGKVLARTNAFHERMLETRDASEKVAAGKDCRVEFRTDKTGRFEAAIFLGENPIPLTLDREAANTFAPPLQKAVELAKRVDEKVRF